MIMKRGTQLKARKILTLAALPAAILAANNALAGVDVYGKVNVTLQDTETESTATATNIKTTTKDSWDLNSNASQKEVTKQVFWDNNPADFVY